MSRTRDARQPVRIVVADDHPLVRGVLCSLLEMEQGFTIVGVAADGVEAVRQVKDLRPDVLLLDLSMPRRDGMAVLRELAGAAAPTRTVVLTGAIERETAQEALRLGARGVVLKESSGATLARCVRAVMRGEVWVGPDGMAGPD